MRVDAKGLPDTKTGGSPRLSVSVGEASRVAVLAQKNGASADLADCYGVYVTTAIRQFGHFEVSPSLGSLHVIPPARTGKILVEVTEEENVAISHRVMQILDRLFAKVSGQVATGGARRDKRDRDVLVGLVPGPRALGTTRRTDRSHRGHREGWSRALQPPVDNSIPERPEPSEAG
eukprot:scaffold2552_cov380-Prasinococcus_capsulatus_cf.AAC.12